MVHWLPFHRRMVVGWWGGACLAAQWLAFNGAHKDHHHLYSLFLSCSPHQLQGYISRKAVIYLNQHLWDAGQWDHICNLESCCWYSVLSRSFWWPKRMRLKKIVHLDNPTECTSLLYCYLFPLHFLNQVSGPFLSLIEQYEMRKFSPQVTWK